LDYHQDSIRVCVLASDGRVLLNRSCPNDVEAVAERILELGTPQACAIEACCGAADFAEQLQEHYGWDVRLSHPGYVRRLKQSPDKSDHDDAWLLADLVRINYLPEVWLAPESTRQLRRLVRYRQQLRQMHTELKQQMLGLLREERIQDAPANPWTKAWLAWLAAGASLGPQAQWVMQRYLARLKEVKAEIALTDERLTEAIADDPLTEKLLAQTGIGLVTATTLRAEIGQFERFRSGKQLARYCGVTPCNAFRQAASRRGIGATEQPRTADRDFGNGASLDASGGTLAKTQTTTRGPRQTGQRSRRGRGQSLDSLVVPSNGRGAGRDRQGELGSNALRQERRRARKSTTKERKNRIMPAGKGKFSGLASAGARSCATWAQCS
jgi:transposase